jgi:putative endonuclease
MYFVYLLFSEKDRKLYTGVTSNLRRRLREHGSQQVKSTAKRLSLRLIYYEAYREQSDAERREKYLKGGNGKLSVKIQLQDHLKKLGYRYL